MKKLFAAAVGAVVITSGAFAANGQQVFMSKGCGACHQASVDTVGPALKKIAKTYKGKKADLIKFLKGQGKPHVDPAKFAIMRPQLNTTKGLPKDQLEALADFILSH
ncbi:MAG: cytochrome C552 [Aquificota bacterium]|nr:MAG: cytochrome C552 [Aquificota bacterium]